MSYHEAREPCTLWIGFMKRVWTVVLFELYNGTVVRLGLYEMNDYSMNVALKTPFHDTCFATSR